MAVVTASFTKSREGAKASLHYILFRPGRKGEKATRQLFGHDGTMTLLQGETLINEAGKGTTFFRIVLSPDPKNEDRYKDLNLWELTQLTILKLEDRLKREIQFVATEHNDHTPNRHVHMIALIAGRLGVEDLAMLRQGTTDIALFQRKELDFALEARQGRGVAPDRPFARTPGPQPHAYEMPVRRGRPARLKPINQVCHLCGKSAAKNALRCYNCGVRLAISLDLGDNGLGDDWDL
jgi:hypothetical protein